MVSALGRTQVARQLGRILTHQLLVHGTRRLLGHIQEVRPLGHILLRQLLVLGKARLRGHTLTQLLLAHGEVRQHGHQPQKPRARIGQLQRR